jgi:peroxiredoxin
MKRVVLIFLAFVSLTAFAGQRTGKLSIGDKAELTAVKMQNVGGPMVSIDDVKGKNGVLVLFSCNTCPFVLRWENRYTELKKVAEANGVGLLVVNSNHQKRDSDDSFDAMKKHASEKGYDFPYVLDTDSRLANTFGGQTTPHAFLFDKNMKLVYKGAIDDNSESASAVTKAYVKDALTELGAGKPIAIAETPPQGCSIKRKLD